MLRRSRRRTNARNQNQSLEFEQENTNMLEINTDDVIEKSNNEVKTSNNSRKRRVDHLEETTNQQNVLEQDNKNSKHKTKKTKLDKSDVGIHLDTSNTIDADNLNDGKPYDIILCDVIPEDRLIKLKINGKQYCYDVLTLKWILDTQKYNAFEPFSHLPFPSEVESLIKKHPAQYTDEMIASQKQAKEQRRKDELDQIAAEQRQLDREQLDMFEDSDSDEDYDDDFFMDDEEDESSVTVVEEDNNNETDEKKDNNRHNTRSRLRNNENSSNLTSNNNGASRRIQFLFPMFYDSNAIGNSANNIHPLVNIPHVHILDEMMHAFPPIPYPFSSLFNNLNSTNHNGAGSDYILIHPFLNNSSDSQQSGLNEQFMFSETGNNNNNSQRQ